jgi:tyrosine-protein kinase Etk/Wzc
MENYKESAFDIFSIKGLLINLVKYKFYYIASLIICLGIAYLVNTYSPEVFQANSMVGPVNQKNTNLLSGSGGIFTGFGSLAEARNLANDIENLKSFALVSRTLSDLDLEVSYYREKTTFLGSDRQYYPDSPIRVIIDKSHQQPVNAKFYVEILSDSTFRLTSSETDIAFYNYIDNRVTSNNRALNINVIRNFNEIISDYSYKFTVLLNTDYRLPPNNDDEEGKLYFVLNHLDQLSMNYLKRLNPEPVNEKSSLINVSFQERNVNLTIDFLNRYLQNHLNENLEKKNVSARNSINFIDAQIAEISEVLVTSESRLREFRSANQVTDLSFQGQRALEQMTRLETERANLQVQERYYNYILDYFSKNNDVAGIAPPSAANVSDPIMTQLIMDLLSLTSQHAAISNDNTQNHIFLPQIENQIRLQKRAITDNVSNNLNTLQLTQNELDYRIERLSDEISRLPRTELNMVSMQRQFNLSDAIYTFLLQRRSEAAISMASNFPDYEIVEPARHISTTTVSPKTLLNWLFSIFLAVMIPTLFIFFKKYLNDKITSQTDIIQITKKRILGTIYRNKKRTEAVVSEYPGSFMAESFRILRSNLFIKIKSEQSKVIMVTSAQPGDGKSFISFNLASSIAAVGHKTVLLDCDLHRPNLHNKFKEKLSPGLSNFISNHTSETNIIRGTFNENLSFISAGPLVPNHSELIESGNLDNLIEFLKSRYEYIILDTTPAGIISDATILMKYANYILLVCRNDYTKKDIFQDVLKRFEENNFRNFDIVFNDVNLKMSNYGRYDGYFKKEKQKAILTG